MIIDGSVVKNAIANELIRLLPGVAIYKEAISKPTFPHFFIYQVSLTNTEERNDVFILEYLLNVRYRVASDPSTELQLQEELDSVAIILLEGFDTVKIEDSYIRFKNKEVEKVDGMLQMTMTTSIMVRKIKKENIKQGKLGISVEVKK